MHVLIPVSFSAPQGGLHENVRATALFLLSHEHRVTIVCPPGPFAEQMRLSGAAVIETDYQANSFTATLAGITKLHQRYPIDLIHAHPFAARQLGVIASQKLGLPCVVTIHGKYTDDLPTHIKYLDAVFPVSEGIRHYLYEAGTPQPEKLYVVPNTPDDVLFQPLSVPAKPTADGKVVVSLVTRIDRDKSFILDVFYQAVQYAANRYPGQIHWQVVGQGTLEDEFVQRVNTLRGSNTVTYTGWLQGEQLRVAYCNSDAVIAPGRCALEAMSCAIPAIALGSKGYNGLVSPLNWQQAAFTNFGGVGNKEQDYPIGAVEADLDTLMGSSETRQKLGKFGQHIARQLFDQQSTNYYLLGLYELVVERNTLHPRIPLDNPDFLELRIQGLKVSKPTPDTLLLELSCERPESLRFAWYLLRDGITIEKMMYEPDPRRTIQLPGEGNYQVRCFVRDSDKRQVSFIGAEANLNKFSWLQYDLNFNTDVTTYFSDSVVSPEVLLKLHRHLLAAKPNVVMQIGGGISTLVVAKALRQNSIGHVIVQESDPARADLVLTALRDECLQPWADLRAYPIEFSNNLQPNPHNVQVQNTLLSGCEGIDLLFIEAPHDAMSDYLHMLPSLFSRLSPKGQIWVVDTGGIENQPLWVTLAEEYPITVISLS